MDKQRAETPKVIDIGDDTAIPDQDFCDQYLDGAERRTSRRYDLEGLPFLMINGSKWRPVNAGKAWLASRIKNRGQEPTMKKRRHRARTAR